MAVVATTCTVLRVHQKIVWQMSVFRMSQLRKLLLQETCDVPYFCQKADRQHANRSMPMFILHAFLGREPAFCLCVDMRACAQLAN